MEMKIWKAKMKKTKTMMTMMVETMMEKKMQIGFIDQVYNFFLMNVDVP